MFASLSFHEVFNITMESTVNIHPQDTDLERKIYNIFQRLSKGQQNNTYPHSE